MTRSPKIQRHIDEAATQALLVDWEPVVGMDTGLCIPIGVYISAFLTERGIHARAVEAGVVIRDPASPRYAFIGGEGQPHAEQDVLAGADEKGLPFFGHLCVWLPTQRRVLDASLPSQPLAILRGLGRTDEIIMGRFDHTKGDVGMKAQIGRGTAVYRFYPKRDGWSKRYWPYEQIKEAARAHARRKIVYAES